MRKRLFILFTLLLAFPFPSWSDGGYRLEKLGDGIYAAIARVGGPATSNAFVIEGRDYVVAGGAHMTKEAITDLFAAIAATTPKPVRYFILSHHHQGFSHIDFDFPPGVDIITSVQTWQALNGEVRKPTAPVLFFSDGMTLKAPPHTIVLASLGKAHSSGDLTVFLPETGILYAGDLLYVRSVGYMGEGHMRNWIFALDFLGELGAKQIIPGYGPVCSGTELDEFRTYFRDFLSTIVAHIERGDSLDQTLKSFALPRYATYEGYSRFLRPNVERAYRDLKQDLATPLDE